MYTLNGEVNVRTTYIAKPGEVERKWYVVDAAVVPLGRLSTVVASVLRSKRTSLLYHQTLIQVTFGAKSFTFDFPHDISPEGMLKGLNSMLPLIVGIIDSTADRQWWLSYPLYTTASAHISCQPFMVYQILSNVSTRDIWSIPLISSGWRSHARCRRNAWFIKFCSFWQSN